LEVITKLVAFIENPEIPESEREKAISELNLMGMPSAEIEEVAYRHWRVWLFANEKRGGSLCIWRRQ